MTAAAARRAAAACFWAALAVSVLLPGSAKADTFAATYRELARSPAGYAASWYSGAVTKDNKFIHGMGHSHASYNNNGLWLYDPATDTHASVAPDTGRFYRFDKDATGKAIAKSGRWAPLDPVAHKALFEYFGGPDIYAPTNRNNHQAFYMPGVDQFWVMAGTSWDNGGWATYARFDLKSQRWVHVSKPWSDPTKSDLKDFSAGMVAGPTVGWAAPNAATAVCMDLDTAVLFGGMSDSGGGVRIIEPNPAGQEPYRWAITGKAPIHLPAENVRHNAACVGDTVYFVSGQERWPNESKLRTPDPAPFWKFHVPTRTWTRLTPGPGGAYFTVMTYDAAAKALLVYGGGTGGGSDRLWVYDLLDGTWHNLTGTVPGLPRVDMHTGGYIPGFGHVYKGGRRFDKSGALLDWTNSAKMMQIVLTRVPGANPPVGAASAANPQTPAAPPDRSSGQAPKTFAPEGAPTTPIPPAPSPVGAPVGAASAANPQTPATSPETFAPEGAPTTPIPPAPSPAGAPVGAASAANPQTPAAPPDRSPGQAPKTFAPEGAPTAPAPTAVPQVPSGSVPTELPARVAASDREQSIVQRVKAREKAARPGARPLPKAAKARLAAPQPTPRSLVGAPVGAASAANPQTPAAPPKTFAPEGAPTAALATQPLRFTWTQIPLPGNRISPVGTMKHMRLVEGPGGRVYLLGGDWGGDWGQNSGRQEVYSFDPLSPTGDWRLEAPYCGTTANPVHWHTDEAGAAWDAKRGVFWKLAGTEYGPDDACLAAGGSVKAKVITFNPTTKLWTVPPGFSQMRFGYVTNGVLDPVGDQMVQITDTKAFHLSLETGTWASHPLPAGSVRFNAFTAKLGRSLWWTNRRGVMESYNLDTHALKQYTKVPWAVPAEGWLMEMVFALPDRLLVVRPTSGPGFPRFAATFDPVTRQWAAVDQGAGWGNAGVMHSSGRLLLMGGGINGPQDVNKQVWVGTLRQ